MSSWSMIREPTANGLWDIFKKALQAGKGEFLKQEIMNKKIER